MEWDQFLFKHLYRLVTSVRSEKKDPARIARAVSLDEIKPRLTALARLLCGAPIALHASEDVGGWGGTTFFLPKSYDRASSHAANLDYYLFRIFYLHGQFQLAHAWKDHPNHGFEASLAAAEAHSAAVLQWLSSEYAAFSTLYERVLAEETLFQHTHTPDLRWVWGKWLYLNPEQWAEVDELKHVVDRNTVAMDKDKSEHSEVEGATPEHTEVLKVDTNEQEQYTLTHNFEKIETLDAFSGRWRDFDGSDDLEEHEEALRELDIRQLVRVDNPVHSIYKAEFVRSLGLIESNHNEAAAWHWAYDEWDQAKRQYKPRYCKVFPSFVQHAAAAYAQEIIRTQQRKIRKMQKQAERFLTDYYIRKRLSWGDEPDLDAMVEAFVDRKSGVTPSENLYNAKRKRTKDVAILVLTDVSLSTDGYTNNRRVLDIEKEALVLAAEVWRQLDVRFQLDTFSSRTHNHCTYQTVKGFHEDWAACRDRVGSVESHGYTRFGPAIRHATHVLDQVRADTKWLLLLTDGKPNDYDQYEGRYGIYDTQKAINEAREKHIHVSGIAIDAQAKFYLPQMFGRGGFEILPHPELLPDVLLNSYLRIWA